MKIKSLIFVLLVVAISGCDKIKDATTIKIDTQLQTSIPVTVTSTGMNTDGLLKAGVIPFSSTKNLLLSENKDVKDYTARIKEINLSNIVITVSGLTGNQTINTVSLDITGIGNIFTQTNITATNNSFTPQISATVLSSVAAKLQNGNQQITFTVSGNTNSPLTCTVSVSFTSQVVVYTIM